MELIDILRKKLERKASDFSSKMRKLEAVDGWGFLTTENVLS